MEVNDLQSGRDLNFRVELTKLDLCAKFQLPSFNRDFIAPDLNFTWKSSLNGTPPLFGKKKSKEAFMQRYKRKMAESLCISLLAIMNCPLAQE